MFRFRNWLQRTAVISTIALVGTSALTGITASPAYAAASDTNTPETVSNLTFQDGTWGNWTVNGSPELSVVPEYFTTEPGIPEFPEAPALPEADEWNATTIYDNGDLATIGDRVFQAQWWTQNQQPGDPNGPWMEFGQNYVANDDSIVADWTASWVYDQPGNVVLFDGQLYENQWYTRNQEPTTPWGPWTLIGDFTPAEPTIPDVEVPSENLVLSIEQTDEWDTIQTPVGMLEPGYTYLMTVAARLADGVVGENQIAFVAPTDGWSWVPDSNGTPITASEWKWHTAEWTITEDMGNQLVYIGTENATDLLIDDVLISRIPAITDPGTPELPGQPEGDVVLDSNLTNSEGGWNWVLEPHGGDPVLIPELNAWRLGSASWGGIADTNLNNAAMTAGETYWFGTEIMAASSEFDGAAVTLNGNPGTQIGSVNISDSEWTVLSGQMQAGAAQQLRVSSSVDGIQILMRSVRMVQVEDTTDPGTPGETVVWSRDFEDGQIAGGDGGTFAVVADPIRDGNLVQSITTSDTWHGLQIPASVFEAGATYRLQADVLAREGAAGENARFEGADDPWPWVVGNHAMSDTEWRTISGTYTWDEIAPMATRLVNGGNGQFFADNVIITRIGDAPISPPTDETVVWERDFEDGQIAGGDGGTFAIVADPIREGNLVQSITTADSWHGLQIPAGTFEAGATYRFQADVLRSAGDAMNARFEGADDPWPWVVGNVAMSDTEWRTISGEFTWDEVDPMAVRLVNGGAGQFFADNVIITRLGGGEEIVTPEPFEPIIVWETDFTDNSWMTNLEGAGAEIGVIANPDGTGQILNVTGRSAAEDNEWRGARIIEVMQAGVEYRVEMTARLIGAETGEVQFRSMPGFGWMNNAAITDDWTEVTSAIWMAGAAPAINLGVAPNGANYQISEIKVWQLSPAITTDPDWEFDGIVWDFEDGTSQDWVARTSSDLGTPVLSVTDNGADGSDHGIRISNRANQGDGPLINVVDILAPMQRFEISGYARFIDREAGNGQLTLSVQHGSSNFTNLLQNIQVRNNEWTYFEGEFTMPAFTNMANLYFETPWAQGAVGDTATFEIDQISIQLPGALKWEQNLIPLSATLPGINTGVAVDTRELTGEHAELILHHFTKLVGENHMKPDFWFAGNGFDTFRMHPQAAAIMDFAVEHDLVVFGHVLVWHSQTPSFFFSRDGVNPVSATNPELTNSREDRDEMLRRMDLYIELVAGAIAERYGEFGTDGNPINSYEVANEVVAGNLAEGNANGGMRSNSPWTRIFFVADEPNSAYEFVAHAFDTADRLFNGRYHVDGTYENPARGANRISLWINDYNTERGGIGTPNSDNTKRMQLLNLVNFLITKGAPIDGVGHQFHAGLEFDVNGLRDALDLFAVDRPWLAAFPDGSRGIKQAITEIDVTIPGINSEIGATQAQLIAQGHYYQEAFDIIRNHQVRVGDIDTVTIWGLTDGRSWRANQVPLLFGDDLISKPAFHGAVANADILWGDNVPEGPEGGWDRPPLQTVVQEANVFGSIVPLEDATFDAPVWGQLPAQNLGGHTGIPGIGGNFTTRYSADNLTILGTINGITSFVSGENSPQPFMAQIAFGGRNLVVHQDGTVTLGNWDGPVVDDVKAITRVDESTDSWRYIVQIPTDAVEGQTAPLNVARRDQSRSNMGAWSTVGDGLLTFVSELGYVEIPQIAATPNIDAAGLTSAVWSDAASVRVERVVSGPANAASADVKAVWGHNGTFATLYLLVDVDDNTPDVTATDSHLQDSVEIFVGLVPNRGGVTELNDAQFRVSRAGNVTFGQGNTGIQAQRITSFVQDNGTDGYQAIIAIDMRTETGHQAGQWDNGLSGLGFFHNFDVQLNDATPSGRAVIAWAGNDTGFNSTARLGVMQFVEAR